MKRIPHVNLLWLIAILALSIITACSGNVNDEPSPPTIHYGEDACELCSMIISEETFAAAYVARDGKGHVFDDVGDMVQTHIQNQEAIAFFVHDYESKAWLRAENASFVHSDELHTPMLSGLAAFASLEKAEALATELGGEVLTFEELSTLYQGMSPMTMQKEGADPSHDH